VALEERIQPDSDIDVQLQRILADPGFQSAPQLSALLSHLVERTLAGQIDDLKATAIAQAVFRRDDSFDAQTDTIVRVEAGRLRRRLAQYYEGNGLHDPLVIDVPKGAYRATFSEPVTPAPEPQPETQATGHPESREATKPTAPTNQSTRKWVALLVLCVGLLLAFLLWRPGAGEKPLPAVSSKPFIMVMPMVYNDTGIGQQVVERSMQAVISKLAKLSDISVMAYRSSKQLATDKVPFSSLRSAHGVTHVLDGYLDIQQNEVLARIEIVETGSKEAIWSENVNGKLGALSDFENLLSNRITAALSVTLDPDQTKRLYLQHGANLEALELFRYALRAIYPPDKGRIMAARDLFQRVTELDPDFAGGYAGLSLTYSYNVLFENSSSPQNDLEQAVAYAEKAIAVDPGFGMGVAMLGVAHTLMGDTQKGLIYTRRAIGLEPGEPLSHQWLALSLIRSGRPQEGIAEIQEALRLDPRDPQMPYLSILGMLHFAVGDNKQAIAAFEEDELHSIRRGPYVYAMQAAAYAELGNEKAARAMIPKLNTDLISQAFPVEHWLGGMLTDQQQQRTLSNLYRIGMLRPEQRHTAGSIAPPQV
jgi:tetratricopeptide (TPR) repeat protein